jgi:hypothetical protein
VAVTAAQARQVVLLAVIAGVGPFTHIRDTAGHSRHKPESRAAAHTSTKEETNTARPGPSSKQDLRAWAAAAAATLPPLTEPQVAAVARLAAHLDADDSQKLAA